MIPVLQNNRLIKALLQQPVDKTPVWMMRQAGRYLPEYQKIRKQAGDFMTLCKTPELACEVTLQPLRRFDLDAAILFSDILTIPDAMGLKLFFQAGEGPKFEIKADNQKIIDALPVVDPHDSLSYVVDAVTLIKKELQNKVPLIGFSGSPWTLATYMIEGGSSKDFMMAKKMAFENPALMHVLLDKLTDSVTDYLNAQIKAGVDAVQIFDSWGGVLSDHHYSIYSLYYIKKIVSGLIREYDGKTIPIIVFTKGGGLWIDKIADIGCDAIGLDWTMNIGKARQLLQDKVALQGNMDPAMLFASPDDIRKEVAQILADYGQGSGHVFNLGHGINQYTPIENVQVFIDAVHELSQK